MSNVTSGGLRVNTTKTEIIVFCKRGRRTEEENWNYAGQNIEVVDNFSYLDAVFKYTGSFTLNQAHLTGKALRAMIFLLCKCIVS